VCWGDDLADESKLVALPPGAVLVDELEGKPDLLDIHHWD